MTLSQSGSHARAGRSNTSQLVDNTVSRLLMNGTWKERHVGALRAYDRSRPPVSRRRAPLQGAPVQQALGIRQRPSLGSAESETTLSPIQQLATLNILATGKRGDLPRASAKGCFPLVLPLIFSLFFIFIPLFPPSPVFPLLLRFPSHSYTTSC